MRNAGLTALAIALAMTPFASSAADVVESEATPNPSQEIDPARYGDFRDSLHDWQVTIGAGAIYMPEYEGSDKFDVKPFPLFSARFGERVSVDITGVTVDLLEYDGFKIGVKGGYELGRKEDDSDYLKGLGDVDPGGVIGGIVSYGYGPFEIYGKLDKTIGGSDGLTGTVGAKASYRYERFIFSADVSGTWADDKHMEAYFGVTATQSASSGLPQYDAKAGVKRVDVKASVTYMLTDNWMVTGAAGAGFLMGDAKDSPIVKKDVQPFGMLGLAYRF
ncbi:MipA/OmpV family protein [Mesorhizobium sp. M1C.F.Ca.ET.193.01.1.1]|nr:MipA/OmpV family protein [Mesorhizobium sp. M1C.F.Ca.ET.210.01.1.1]TGQ65826.1 MipA/OmpV family protein [Mesorhizobium sp. M1C.F.Ca.ET.212.01.1.1]TGQ99771.1 MipA/OmpV family protein [Mesorhizobium sp. M1C.F.Ca.ET.204.01.1.1]TGR20187.1 MipA/OmpV family protein [Mesorhizobium sp. M1C.F.Ca.ET.196.01.1.1]TGR42570.1 MipA/OmpV family protein [Mesorhizobium sp. M1C.F.Ca.ET.195.01.1.1]TGR61612.1 MipA/OmpV family protein [Mesorhizobium sp. M1C.F.Ca.ET.192.01.1.1]TGR74735.1 MipA/OmpV family protein [